MCSVRSQNILNDSKPFWFGSGYFFNLHQFSTKNYKRIEKNKSLRTMIIKFGFNAAMINMLVFKNFSCISASKKLGQSSAMLAFNIVSYLSNYS